MRAVRVAGPGDVAVVDVPPPHPAPGEVLVNVVAAAVCSTDRKFATRDHAEPRTLGHEITGRLDDGTPVGIHPEVACQQCPACREGWHNRCPDRQSIGLDRDGGLAGLISVPSIQLIPLGELDPTISTMLEPLACAVHAIDAAGLGTGAPAVVVGAGAMGILAAWVLQAHGSAVVICQRSHERRRLAGELGFDAVIGPDDDPAQHLGTAPAAVVVTAPGADPLRWAMHRVAVGGTVHVFAGTPGSAPVDANVVHYRHVRLVGSTGSRREDYETARDLVASGEIKLGRIPHEVIRLDGAPAAVLARPPDAILKTIVAVN